MPLTAEQWTRVQAATDELRSLGCAVCVFTPDDVESAIEVEQQAEVDETKEAAERTPEETAALHERSTGWMERNAKWLQDTMSTAGNHHIADNLDS